MPTLRIGSQKGVAFCLKQGQGLTVIDPDGGQVADLFCADALNSSDSFSAGRTIDYNESIYIKPGHFLFSQTGQRLMEVAEDRSPGLHDLLVTPCSLQMFQMMMQNADYHPSCLENLAMALQDFGISEWQITSTLNIFMNIAIENSGKIHVKKPLTKPRDQISFFACRDLIVGLTACSDEGTNGGCCKPIEYIIS